MAQAGKYKADLTHGNALASVAIVAVIIAVYLVIYFGSASPKSLNLITTLMLFNGVLASTGILSDQRLFSISKMHWYFQLVFMSMAPFAQYINGYYPSSYLISDDYFLAACLIVLVWNICFLFFYNARSSRKGTKRRRSGKVKNFVLEEKGLSLSAKRLLAFAAVVSFLLSVALIGFDSMFVKAENTVSLDSSTLSFIVKKTLSALPAMACAILILSRKGKSSAYLLIVIALGMTILVNFPTSTTRYWMGTIFCGLIFAFVKKETSTRWADFAICLVLLLVFPLFYIFKYNTLDTAVIDFSSFLNIADTFCSIDYDAFMLLSRTIQYVDTNGLSFGYQLINIILFFIPRSVWPGKPHPSNIVVASSQGSTFTNLSCPIQAEGYINFGVVGVILFCFIVARFVKWLDSAYWDSARSRDSLSLLNVCYPFLAVIVIYISRGPLQPSFIQTLALILPAIVIFFLLKREAVEESDVVKTSVKADDKRKAIGTNPQNGHHGHLSPAFSPANGRGSGDTRSET